MKKTLIRQKRFEKKKQIVLSALGEGAQTTRDLSVKLGISYISTRDFLFRLEHEKIVSKRSVGNLYLYELGGVK